tara:strand:+ start:8035 stop:8613 length:579 start_codon:yes stop_codon:yes gene_type:complete
MKVYPYKDYKEYVDIQTKINKEKLSWVYVYKETIQKICNVRPKAKRILCHGTRNGAEQKMFMDILGCYAIGSEISDNAYQFEHTIQWDFTEPREEWINSFDIVYSNSFDHTIDPYKTLQTWKEQLKDDGMLCIEYSENQSVGSEADPLDATNKEMLGMIKDSGLSVFHEITGCKNGGIVWCCHPITKSLKIG